MTDFYRVKELSDAIKRSKLDYGSNTNDELLDEILKKCQVTTTLSSPEKKYVYGLCSIYCDRMTEYDTTTCICELGKLIDSLSLFGAKTSVYRSLALIEIVALEIQSAHSLDYTAYLKRLDSIDAGKLRSDYPDLSVRYQSIVSLCYFKIHDFVSFEKAVNKGIEVRGELTNMANHILLENPRVFRAGLVLQNLNSELLYRNGKWNQSARSRLSTLVCGLHLFERDQSDVLFNNCLNSLVIALLITSVGHRKLINLNEFMDLISSNPFIYAKIDPKLVGILAKLYNDQIVDLQLDFIPIFTTDVLKFYNFAEIDTEGFRYVDLIGKGIKSTIEHNVISISKVFYNIPMDHIRPLMNCPSFEIDDERIQGILFDLILSNNLDAEIDQVSNLLIFTRSGHDKGSGSGGSVNANELGWDNRINSFFEELDSLTKLIK